MKKSYLAICSLIALLQLFSCSSYRNEETRELNSSEESQNVDNSERETEFYVCQGDTILVENTVGSPKRLSPYKSILECLNETGRYGDVEANKEIKRIITRTGHQGLENFRRMIQTNQLRGDDIFDAILNLGTDDTPVYGLDGDVNDWSKTMTFIAIEYLIAMIETIDGNKNLPIYIHKQNENIGSGISSFGEYIVARDRAYFKTIKQAWEDGLIVLKPYYNK